LKLVLNEKTFNSHLQLSFMYYLIDEQKIRAYYILKLELGEIVDQYKMQIKNVKYIFDENFHVKEIYAIDEPAYVITDHGLVKWDPPYMIFLIIDTNTRQFRYAKSFIDFVKWQKKCQISTNLLGSWVTRMEAKPLCFSYVCYEYPENAIQLTKDNFVVNPNKAKIYENKNNLIIKTPTNVSHSFIGINVDGKTYNISATFADKIVLKRGTCFFIDEKDIFACY